MKGGKVGERGRAREKERETRESNAEMEWLPFLVHHHLN
jgi:hypothetical protein